MLQKIIEICKVIFPRFLFDKDIETYERKLFHHQANFMKISFDFYVCSFICAHVNWTYTFRENVKLK